MKSSQVAILIIGIAVLIVILVLLGDIELFDGANKKPVTYIGLDQEEKRPARQQLELKPISEAERVGENVGGALKIQKDWDINIKKGETVPFTFKKNALMEWKCYQFTDADKALVDQLMNPAPVAENPPTTGTELQIPTEGFYYKQTSEQESTVKPMDKDTAEKAVCESSPDRIWTNGDNTNYPKCGSCKCCVQTPITTCEPDSGLWSVTDEFGKSQLLSPCCQPTGNYPGDYKLPINYKTCGDPTLNSQLPVDKCIIECCSALSTDKTKYDESWYPMSRCACSLWCYHQAAPHFARYGTATGYIYRRPSVQNTFYYGQ